MNTSRRSSFQLYICMIPQVLSQNNHKIKAIRALGVQKQRNSSITNMSRTISGFAGKHNAGLTVMDSGKHWFHTEDQMRFLDEWILREEHKSPFPLKNENEDAGNTLSIPHKDFHNDLIIPRSQLLIIFYPDRKFSFSRQSITQTPSDW